MVGAKSGGSAAEVERRDEEQREAVLAVPCLEELKGVQVKGRPERVSAVVHLGLPRCRPCASAKTITIHDGSKDLLSGLRGPPEHLWSIACEAKDVPGLPWSPHVQLRAGHQEELPEMRRSIDGEQMPTTIRKVE